MSTNDTLRGMFEVAASSHKVEGIGFNFSKTASGAYINNETRMLFEGWKLAAMAEPASGGAPETDDKFWKEKLAIQYCEQRNLDNGTYAYAVAVDAFISGLSIKPALNGGAVDGQCRDSCRGGE